MNGFFLGGMAEGAETANRQALAEQTLRDNTGLRTRALDLEEQRMRDDRKRQDLERGDKLIADAMGQVAENIRHATAVGRDPAATRQLVQPIVDSAKVVAARVGRDPNALDSQVSAMLGNPGAVENAGIAGRAAATQAVAQDAEERRLLQQQNPGSAEPELQRRYKTSKEKTDAENALRDDFTKQAKDFVTIRDAKNRIDNVDQTGAGDIALLFQYMKMLDPNSVVRESEFATAAKVAGVPGQIETLRNKVLGEGQLSMDARRQIRAQADRLYQTAAAQHDRLQTDFANKAKRQGLSPDVVLVDYSPVPFRAVPLPRSRPAVGERTDLPALPAGFSLVR